MSAISRYLPSPPGSTEKSERQREKMISMTVQTVVWTESRVCVKHRKHQQCKGRRASCHTVLVTVPTASLYSQGMSWSTGKPLSSVTTIQFSSQWTMLKNNLRNLKSRTPRDQNYFQATQKHLEQSSGIFTGIKEHSSFTQAKFATSNL